MITFNTYLKENDYSKGTIASYLRAQEFFIKWCESRGFEYDMIDYKGCLQYVKKIQQPRKGKSISKSTVRHDIGALKIYFNYLTDENYRGDNPFQNMNIRGAKRSLNHNLLEFEELEDLFYSLPTHNLRLPQSSHVAVRDKVIIGLMIYQGLNATALKTLKLEDVNLEKAEIYVPSTRKTNARTLQIKSPQILSLAQYIEESRPELQETINCHSDAFFPYKGERYPFSYQLFKKLKRINLNVKDDKQIRASVITYWLKTHNIREVQYMAGHRYISSTERYVQDNLENLHEMIDTFHPIS